MRERRRESGRVQRTSLERNFRSEDEKRKSHTGEVPIPKGLIKKGCDEVSKAVLKVFNKCWEEQCHKNGKIHYNSNIKR